MMEADDKLLKQFFAEQKQEIADEGFSGRVMQHLPGRAQRLSGIWTSVCTAIAIVLFFVFDGLQVFTNIFREAFIAGVQYFSTTCIDLKTLLIVAGVLLLLGFNKLFSME